LLRELGAVQHPGGLQRRRQLRRQFADLLRVGELARERFGRLPGGRRSPGPRVLFPRAPSVPSSIWRFLMSVLSTFSKWFRGLRSAVAPVRKRPRARLGLESLGGRDVPSATSLFQQTNLVSDLVGLALNLDPTLINAWGISAAPNSGAFWVSSSGRGL